LDNVFEEHEELADTAVREFMYNAAHKSFIVPQADYRLPDDFGMFSEDGNKKVKAALSRFLTHPDLLAAAKQLHTPMERVDALQDPEVESSVGNTQDEYFGYAETPQAK